MDAPFLAISDDKMRPRPSAGTESHDRFRNRLQNRLDPRHARVRLAGILDGSRFDETFGVRYGPDRGSPGQPPRGMVGRESLQPVYPLSDEAVVAGWVENPYWQSFCGEEYCPPHPPIDPSRRTGRSIDEVFVDRGDWGHGEGEASGSRSGQRRGLVTRRRKQCRRRRQAMEPVIGHRKSDGHPGRNGLPGREGDRRNVLRCGAGHHRRRILRPLRFLGRWIGALEAAFSTF